MSNAIGFDMHVYFSFLLKTQLLVIFFVIQLIARINLFKHKSKKVTSMCLQIWMDICKGVIIIERITAAAPSRSEKQVTFFTSDYAPPFTDCRRSIKCTST